mgnify:CR=1 FL=1
MNPLKRVAAWFAGGLLLLAALPALAPDLQVATEVIDARCRRGEIAALPRPTLLKGAPILAANYAFL